MKMRTFPPDKVYRLVELRPPYWKFQEALVNSKIRFFYEARAKQDLAGFLFFNREHAPHFEVLSGSRKGQRFIGLPPCRILAIRPRDLRRCSCPAFSFPHRPGSGGCPYA